MAGGRFDKLVGKVRPGTYINFESGRENAVISNGTRGTVIVPLPKATYGPAKQFIKLTSASPDAAAATFGYSIYDDDPNRQMLLIREAFKRATTVYVYILTEGKEATADITMTLAAKAANEEAGGEETPATNKLTATAKYGGTRGNLLTVTVDWITRISPLLERATSERQRGRTSQAAPTRRQRTRILRTSSTLGKA